MINSKQDHVLINDYIQGNDNALDVLIKKYENRIYGFIYSEIPNKTICNDIFQETFIKAIKAFKSGSYNERNKFPSWILRISHNLVMDHYRQNVYYNRFFRSFDDNIHNAEADQSSIAEHIMVDRIHKNIKKTLKKLPAEQKEIIILKFFDNMTHKEIAELKKISINTSIGRVRYALINLRKIVSKNKIFLASE